MGGGGLLRRLVRPYHKCPSRAAATRTFARSGGTGVANIGFPAGARNSAPFAHVIFTAARVVRGNTRFCDWPVGRALPGSSDADPQAPRSGCEDRLQRIGQLSAPAVDGRRGGVEKDLARVCEFGPKLGDGAPQGAKATEPVDKLLERMCECVWGGGTQIECLSSGCCTTKRGWLVDSDLGAVCVCARARACVCVCVGTRARQRGTRRG